MGSKRGGKLRVPHSSTNNSSKEEAIYPSDLDLWRYQLYLVDQRISAVSLNAAITVLKFFFDATPDRHELMGKMQSVRMPIPLNRPRATSDR